MMEGDILRTPVPTATGPHWGLPVEPGLGVEVNIDVVREFMVPVRIELSGLTVFESERL